MSAYMYIIVEKHISYKLRQKRAQYLNDNEVNLITLTMNTRERQKLPAERRKPPSNQFDCCEIKFPPATMFRSESLSLVNGMPLYRVTINAPAMETTVPMLFAWLLCTFTSNFSILKE